jgi:hypothetical protein
VPSIAVRKPVNVQIIVGMFRHDVAKHGENVLLCSRPPDRV